MVCRFAENPMVIGAPFIRFYAGAPLVLSSGDRVGTVCIVDDRPRELEAQSLNVLINFAEVVVRELEKEQARVRPCLSCFHTEESSYPILYLRRLLS